jgi:ribose transport system substrate-binding protein
MIGEHFVKYVNEQMGGSAKLGIVGALNSTIRTSAKGFETW